MTGPPTKKGAIQRKRSRSAQDQSHERGEIKQVCLVPGLSKVSAGGGHRLKLDRTEAVGKMYREDRNQQLRDHRHTHKRNKQACQHGQSSEDLDKDGGPS